MSALVIGIASLAIALFAAMLVLLVYNSDHAVPRPLTDTISRPNYAMHRPHNYALAACIRQARLLTTDAGTVFPY